METLRLTTLAVLIPVGFFLEAAEAYPEHFGQTLIAEDQGLDGGCIPAETRRPDFGKPSPDVMDLYDSTMIQVAPTNSKTFHNNRRQPVDTCRLDLDLIEQK